MKTWMHQFDDKGEHKCMRTNYARMVLLLHPLKYQRTIIILHDSFNQKLTARDPTTPVVSCLVMDATAAHSFLLVEHDSCRDLDLHVAPHAPISHISLFFFIFSQRHIDFPSSWMEKKNQDRYGVCRKLQFPIIWDHHRICIGNPLWWGPHGFVGVNVVTLDGDIWDKSHTQCRTPHENDIQSRSAMPSPITLPRRRSMTF